MVRYRTGNRHCIFQLPHAAHAGLYSLCHTSHFAASCLRRTATLPIKYSCPNNDPTLMVSQCILRACSSAVQRQCKTTQSFNAAAQKTSRCYRRFLPLPPAFLLAVEPFFAAAPAPCRYVRAVSLLVVRLRMQWGSAGRRQPTPTALPPNPTQLPYLLICSGRTRCLC